MGGQPMPFVVDTVEYYYFKVSLGETVAANCDTSEVIPEFSLAVAKAPPGGCSRATGVFPLRFRRQGER